MKRRRSPRRVRVALRPARARYRTRRVATSLLKPAVVLLLTAGTLAWGTGAVRETLSSAQWTRVQGVEIVPLSLQDGTPPEGFDRAIGLSAGDSQFAFSTWKISRRLLDQFPELERVRARRSLDGRVRVFFSRRRAVAKVWEGGQWLGMDKEGDLFPFRVFAPEEAPPEALMPEERLRPLPILAGVPPGSLARPYLEFADLLRRLPESWVRGFYKMKLTPSGNGLLYLKEGEVVHWGRPLPLPTLVQEKSRRLERVLKDARVAEGVDVARFVDDRRIAVKLKKESDAGRGTRDR